MHGKIKNSSGFTLIEMSIVLIFFSLFAGLFINAYVSYQNEQQRKITREHIDYSWNAIDNFYNATGRYPCPARLSARPADPDYGLENCDGTGLDANFTAAPETNFINLDGIQHPPTERVMAGAIPFNTIAQELGQLDDQMVEAGYAPYFSAIKNQITERISLDAYGNKMTYIVTRELADLEVSQNGKFNDKRGAVVVVDETYTQPLDIQTLSLRDVRRAHYAIISHGPNGKGAFTQEGNIVETCLNTSTLPPGPPGPPGPPITTPQNEQENCDVASAAELNGAVINGVYNTSSNSYFDDIVYLGDFASSELWRTLDYPDIDKIVPTVTGNLGIGKTNPDDKLDLRDGNMRADALKAHRFCDANGDNCMSAESIGGSDANMQCPLPMSDPDYNPNNQILIGIANNKAICGMPTITQLNATCPLGPPRQFLRGIRISSGVTTPICELP